jgi:membrane fusion protein, multidrug efflux system
MALKPFPSIPSPPAPRNTVDMPDASNDIAERAPSIDYRRYAMTAAAAVVSLLAVWKGADWWTTGRFEVRTDNAYVRADITTVASKIQGYVDQIAVKDNQAVKAGELLIVLEGADYSARLAEAAAALAQAEAQAAQARAEVSSRKSLEASALAEISAQRDRLAEARAAVQSMKAGEKLANDDLMRYTELAAKGHYPAARLDSAKAESDAATADADRSVAAVTTQKSQLNVAEAGLTRARQDIAAAEAAVAGADAQVAAARARMDAAQLDVGRAEIRAPISGVVANRVVSEGQLLSPGQQALSIVPVDQAYVIANFKETQVEKMRPGQKVELHVDAYPDLKVEGTVESLAPASGAQFSLMPQDTATGNFTKIVQRVPVRLAISKEALATGLMRPGLSVEAIVSVKPAKS